MENITAKTQYDGTTSPVPATSVHTADELNDRIVEQEGSVTDSGQSLDVLDAGQQSKAMFANGVAAQSMLDSGGVNSVVLTPITGASGLRVATPLVKTYALLNGAIFSFKANNTNTGNMTVNVGQTGGAVIGAQPLFLEDGSTNIPVGMVVADRYYEVRYDSSLDVDGAFVLLSSGVYVPEVYTGQQSVTLPNGMIMKFGKVTNVPTSSYKIVTFSDAFPNACISAIANFGERGQSAQDGADDCGTSSVTSSSIRVWSYGISTSIDCYWQAFGW